MTPEANPILVELTRNGDRESFHRGAFAITDAEGAIVAAQGDIERLIFPRSAIKSMQALALFRSGAVEKFGLSDQAIALACASHDGEKLHTDTASDTLHKLGLSASDLECGAHAPKSARARAQLRKEGEEISTLHNNCSGKHTGMLADALAMGVPTTGYIAPDHPVQQLVRQGVEEALGEKLSDDVCGTDGCSLPAWAAPLKTLARGFARMATGEGLDPDLRDAATRIFDAATAHPELVRAAGTLDTDLMAAFAGRLMLKIGAEGVYCGALRDKGWGIALKIDDGKEQAAEVLVANLLLATAEPNESERTALERFAHPIQRNWRGFEVAQYRGTEASRPAIS